MSDSTDVEPIAGDIGAPAVPEWDASRELALATVDAAAAKAGVAIPEALRDSLDVSKFLGDDGRPSSDAIETFVGSLPAPSRFSPPPGLGPQSDGPPTPQTFNPADLAGMSQAEIFKAMTEGRINMPAPRRSRSTSYAKKRTNFS